MKYLKQFLIIIGITLAGEVLHRVIPLPIPAGIYGLMILFGALASGILKLEKVREAGMFLIEIMPIMFIPPTVGIIESGDVLSGQLPAYIAAVTVVTVLVMGVSGLVTQLFRKGGKEAADE